VRLRPATLHDWARLYAWRFEPSAAAASGRSAAATISEHLDWLGAALTDPFRRLYVGEDGGPVGYVRLDMDGDNEAVVSIAVDPARRNEGCAAGMLAALTREARRLGLARLKADIRVGNVGSMRAFASAGYLPVPDHPRVAGYVMLALEVD
jgi:RimJ/RimL family protein N-acetyltransferase